MKIRQNRVKQKLADGDLAYVISGLTSADDIDNLRSKRIRRRVVGR